LQFGRQCQQLRQLALDGVSSPAAQ
jgi:hypothetical protein